MPVHSRAPAGSGWGFLMPATYPSRGAEGTSDDPEDASERDAGDDNR